jgi:hypothetical protein
MSGMQFVSLFLNLFNDTQVRLYSVEWKVGGEGRGHDLV